MGIGPWEVLVVLAIVLIIFGAGKLPEVGGALGKGIRQFRRTMTDDDEQKQEERDTQTKPKQQERP
ncbi:MAG: twin-arginine translocase TatA/TatE family subunit [Chloroflexi bacterium]|nr:twin-arginine translocase TatA/TatE family subunit [Chloroflexota bacterium]